MKVFASMEERNHDLAIKPAENPNWRERLFGCNDMNLLRQCPCPVRYGSGLHRFSDLGALLPPFLQKRSAF